MARRKLRSPDQPWVVQGALALFEFASSLKLAVIVILSSAAVLAVATFVESRYGLRAVHFGIYGTAWFTALNFFLALNIFCAAAIRYPWQRHQTGFVITHIGLLTLMFGTLLSRRGGIDAQMLVWEDQHNYRAFEDSEHLELEIRGKNAPTTGETSSAPVPRSSRAAADELVQVLQIPFAPGPFNWRDYDQLPWFPWALVRPQPGVIYEHEGVRVELLDYYSNSVEVPVPRLRLALSNPRAERVDDSGRRVAGGETFTEIPLSITAIEGPYAGRRPYGQGARQSVGGGKLVFWLTGSAAEVESFTASAPEGELGPQGQVVLWAGGARHVVNVAERVGQGKFALGESGLELELTSRYATAALVDLTSQGLKLEETDAEGPARRPAVELLVHPAGGQSERMVLFADLPEYNEQAYRLGVFGSYWFDHGEKSAEQLLRGEGGSRIDILAGPGGRLWYRYWNRRQVVAAAELPRDGTLVEAFKMPVAQLRMKVAEFLPADEPTIAVRPVEFSKDTTPPDANRAARLRLTVDGQSDEFWLVGPRMEFAEQPLVNNQRRVVTRPTREMVATLPLDEVDVGFNIRLEKFSRRLDPGTSTPSHYGSVVDLLDRKDPQRELAGDLEISMNAPIDFTDPTRGRSYRLFQESFRGPFPRESEIYETAYRGAGSREQAFCSILTVNYDPGRGVKYVGCLLVVTGIATMFYMRAYFFKRPSPAEAAPAAARERTAELAVAER